MNSARTQTRLIGIASALLVAILLFVVGTWLETKIFDGLTHILENQSFLSIILFFSIVNLNAVLAFVLIFLSFRNAVKLVVERQRAVFGSSLRTRLVTLFLFFSLVPTLILLYISTKFVNVHFERWLPPSIVQTSEVSLRSEAEYREKLLHLLSGIKSNTIASSHIDFSIPIDEKSVEPQFIHDKYFNYKGQINSVVRSNASKLNSDPRWLTLDSERFLAVVRHGSRFIGLISPPTIHTRWQLLAHEVSEAQPGVELVRLSYYLLLGALTVLLIFSALWLGVTIARELTGPLQALAQATESVAQGDYEVNIDDVVSDDELGQLARSFRSMVGDLRDANQRARASAEELQLKAALLSEKTEYYASVLQEVQAAVVALAADFSVEACNPAAERLFSLDEQKARGRSLAEFLPRDFYEHWLYPLLRPLVEESLHRVEGEYAGRLGALEYQLLVTGIALHKPNHERAYLIIVEDVTDIARAQRLAAWREVARKVAHEIKNPLTPIKLGAQRLERRLMSRLNGEDAEVMGESVRVIVQSADAIKQLVDEFVSVARMPGPKMRLANIVETLRLSAAAFSDNPEQIMIAIEIWNPQQKTFLDLRNDAQVSLDLKHDPEQIARAMFNLVSNAIAASSGVESASRVVIRVGSENSNGDEIEIAVVDWGHGVPESVRDRIFEPYFSTKRTGTGLGLVIVQQIIHEHGGRLRVAGNEPRGTVFTMTLPVGETEISS